MQPISHDGRALSHCVGERDDVIGCDVAVRAIAPRRDAIFSQRAIVFRLGARAPLLHGKIAVDEFVDEPLDVVAAGISHCAVPLNLGGRIFPLTGYSSSFRN